MRIFTPSDDQITIIRGALELAGDKYRANAAERAAITGPSASRQAVQPPSGAGLRTPAQSWITVIGSCWVM